MKKKYKVLFIYKQVVMRCVSLILPTQQKEEKLGRVINYLLEPIKNEKKRKVLFIYKQVVMHCVSLILPTQQKEEKLGRVAQLVTCRAAEKCLTADPGVPSSIWARSHTFMEIDHEIIFMVILLSQACPGKMCG